MIGGKNHGEVVGTFNRRELIRRPDKWIGRSVEQLLQMCEDGHRGRKMSDVVTQNPDVPTPRGASDYRLVLHGDVCSEYFVAIDPVIESGCPDPSVESVVDAKRGTQPRRSAPVDLVALLPFHLLGMFQMCFVDVAGGALVDRPLRGRIHRAGSPLGDGPGW
ncbi:hypothetical protein GCM10020255_104250 [Rhodococcus baikonurensis]